MFHIFTLICACDEFKKSAKAGILIVIEKINNLAIKSRANLLKDKGAKPLGLRGMPMTARLQFVLMSYVMNRRLYIFGFILFL